jgi:hypothetical protein
MSFFLSQATEHLEQGLERQREGDTGQARYHYLKAAEYLFKAAKRAEGREKLRRTERSVPSQKRSSHRVTTQLTPPVRLLQFL